ncbi:MAG: protein translocase subunit SecF [Spirochaetota bacterium]|nr:protein translocase subunit SecF [Spirochaetota bacterium]
MNRSFDFIKNKKYTFLFSGSILLIGLILFIVRGGFKYGSDFQGGVQIQVDVGQKATINDISKAFKSEKDVTTIGSNGQEFLIKTVSTKTLSGKEEIDQIAKTEIIEPLRKLYPKLDIKNRKMFSPTMGAAIKSQAVQVTILILVLVLLYIGLRFQIKFGIAAIIALIHDLCIIMCFALFFNHEVDIQTIVALLTIMGYSLNDTIIVFDRIRENKELMGSDNYVMVINKSINQTLNRTLVTSLTTLIVVMCIYIFGGPALESLSFSLIVGIVFGTYSSIYIASPTLDIWENYIDKRNAKKGKDRKVVPKKKKQQDKIEV